MSKLLMVLCAVWAIASASAATFAGGAQTNQSNSASLRERALGLAADSREDRPTGQCIVSCEDRLITLRRCPDGECPDYDCRTGHANCGAR